MERGRHISLFTNAPKQNQHWDQLENDLVDALRKYVPLVQQHTGTSEAKRNAPYVGDIGAALMNLFLSDRLSSPNILSSADLKGQADQLILAAFTAGALPVRVSSSSQVQIILPKDASHISFLESPVGLAALILSRYPIAGQTVFAEAYPISPGTGRGADAPPWVCCREYLHGVLDLVEEDDNNATVHGEMEDDDGCEVLYGRAGFLYALLFLRKAMTKNHAMKDRNQEEALETVKDLVNDKSLQRVIDSIIVRGRAGAKFYKKHLSRKTTRNTDVDNAPPLMWSWHGKRYLGGAHGVAGILQILLSSPSELIKPHVIEIVRTVDWLVACQDREGNWPTKAPDSSTRLDEHHELIQWCHGAPSMLTLLSTVLRLSLPSSTSGKSEGGSETPFIRLSSAHQNRFATSLQRGAALVYIRGMLRKGVGLCHGVAGNIWALLEVGDILDEGGNSSGGEGHKSRRSNALSSSSPTPAPSPASSSSARQSPHQQKHEQEKGEDKRAQEPKLGTYLTLAAHLASLSANHFEELTKHGEMHVPDRPWSLYEGLGGACCVWGEVLERIKDVRKGEQGKGGENFVGMIGYDDLG